MPNGFQIEDNVLRGPGPNGGSWRTLATKRNGVWEWAVQPTANSIAALGTEADAPFFYNGQSYTWRGGLVASDNQGNPLQEELGDELRRQMDEADAANEQRYQEGLAGYGRQFSRAEQIGLQNETDIRRDYRGLQAQNQQDITSRGLTGTTILPSSRMGIQREQTSALARNNESRLGMLNQIENNRIGFIERRSDVAPSLVNYMALAGDLGNSGLSSLLTGNGGSASATPTAARATPTATTARSIPTVQSGFRSRVPTASRTSSRASLYRR